MTLSLVTRRAFLRRSACATAAAVAFPAILRTQGGQTANDRLNNACVGVGGRGKNAVLELQDENRVAFCDVDDARAAVINSECRALPASPTG